MSKLVNYYWDVMFIKYEPLGLENFLVYKEQLFDASLG